MYLTRYTAYTPTRPAFTLLVAVFALFLFSSPVHAEPTESHTGFSHSLETPPAFTAQTGTQEDPPDCTTPGNSASSTVCAISPRQNPTRRASIKNGYLDNTDTVDIPGLGNSGQKIEKALSASEKDEYDWDVEVEFRDSAVLEETGNAKRNESKGALIKGNLKF